MPSKPPVKARRIERIQPFHVMALLARARQLEAEGRDIVHMEIGEPDFPTPQPIVEAGMAAIREGAVHYTPATGLPELRETISGFYQAHDGLELDPRRIIITPGASGALLLALGVLLERDEAVMMADPGYPCNRNFVTFLEGETQNIPVSADEAYQLTPGLVSDHWQANTRDVLLASPSNPTGNLLSAARMQAISTMGPHVVSDEIYHGLVYEGQEHSILEFSDQAFVLNGFSKLYAMTGFRLGYLIAPPAFIRPIQKMVQNFFISANTMVQKAGVAALTQTDDDTARMRTTYNERRLFMIRRLREMGFGITVEPTGAFYVFANARHISNDSYRLAFDILENARVGVTPGIDFGPNAEGYLRFSYANSLDNIAEGMDRLERYLTQHG